MVRHSILKTGFAVGVCAIFLFVQFGCATQPQTLPMEARAQLGRIGVVTAQYTPAVEFELPAKGWIRGAGRGAKGGTKAFIVLVPSGAIVAGVSAGAVCCTFGALVLHGLVGALWATAALIKGTGYLIIGPFYGAAKAETPATVEEAEVQLKNALVSLRIQETMRDHVIKAAQGTPEVFLKKVNLRALEGKGPESTSDLLTYFPLQEINTDTVLELRVDRVWLSTEATLFQPLTSMVPYKKSKGKAFKESPFNPYQELGINPPLSLGMEVRGRLIRTADKVVLFDNTWKHEGEAHLFAEWAANDAQLFIEELQRAYDALSKQMVGAIF